MSDEPVAQLSRLRYILSQACKEGIVARPEQWRGAHCVRELMNGQTTLQGQWVDRTAWHREGRYRRTIDASKFTSAETLVLTALPCFEAVTSNDQSAWIRRCVDEIALEARSNVRRRRRRGTRRTIGADSIDAVDIHAMKRSPAPWFHVASAICARELKVAYILFLALYRSAAEKLKAGLEARFPEGSFPPARPYVRA